MAGDSGGVTVGRKDIENSKFYVADDEKSIVVQDLIEDVKDRNLKTDFFLALLNDMTDIIKNEDKFDFDDEIPEVSECFNDMLLFRAGH